jgi:hypothetical protein
MSVAVHSGASCSGLLAALLLLGLANTAGAQTPTHRPPKTDPEHIANAMSAAPQAISRNATIMVMQNDKMRTVRKGSGLWTCFSDDPSSPGNDPMCLDANAMEWFTALMDRKEPAKGKVGLVYMLQGGSDASNDDPFATSPPAGKKWIATGPHVMVTGATDALAAFPKTADDPSKPYVMWPGTPYSHIMMPVK